MKTLMLLLACAAAAMASTVTLTMDEVSSRPINGLAVVKGGITFTFSDAGGGLSYDSADGGQMTYVQDPCIQGTAEPFGVTFSVPVYVVKFGMAADVQSPAQLATVSLYNGATLITTLTLNSSKVDSFAEGQMIYASPYTPVTSMTVTPGPFEAIAFDNLFVDTTPVPAGVPAASPLAFALLASLIAGFGAYALRGRLRASRDC